MGIPAQRDRAFPQLVLPHQALGVLPQLGQRGLPDIHVGVAAQMHRADLGRHQHRRRLTHRPTSPTVSGGSGSISTPRAINRASSVTTSRRVVSGNDHHRCAGAAGVRSGKHELDGVRGYSQGAQIGSPSRNRWREQGTGRTYLPLYPGPRLPLQRHTSPCSRSDPVTVQHQTDDGSDRRRREDIGRIRPNRSRATVRQLDHQQQLAVPPLEPRRLQHITEQRMRQQPSPAPCTATPTEDVAVSRHHCRHREVPPAARARIGRGRRRLPRPLPDRRRPRRPLPPGGH